MRKSHLCDILRFECSRSVKLGGEKPNNYQRSNGSKISYLRALNAYYKYVIAIYHYILVMDPQGHNAFNHLMNCIEANNSTALLRYQEVKYTHLQTSCYKKWCENESSSI